MPDEVRRYRPCVGLALFNRDGLVFVGRRRLGSGAPKLRHYWQMPQGGIDRGEAPYDAAIRELYEETNVRSASLLAESQAWFSYDIPTPPSKPTEVVLPFSPRTGMVGAIPM